MAARRSRGTPEGNGCAPPGSRRRGGRRLRPRCGEQLPFERAAEADLDRAEPDDPVELSGRAGVVSRISATKRNHSRRPFSSSAGASGWVRPSAHRSHASGSGPDGRAAGHDRRLASRDRAVEGRAVRVEERAHGCFRIASAFDFPAGEMERGGIPDEVDDGGAVSGVVEIGEAEIVVRHHELLEMRVAVDRPRRQPPAQVAERRQSASVTTGPSRLRPRDPPAASGRSLPPPSC